MRLMQWMQGISLREHFKNEEESCSKIRSSKLHSQETRPRAGMRCFEDLEHLFRMDVKIYYL